MKTSQLLGQANLLQNRSPLPGFKDGLQRSVKTLRHYNFACVFSGEKSHRFYQILKYVYEPQKIESPDGECQ